MLGGAAAAEVLPYWRDLSVVSKCRLEPRTEFVVYSTREAALSRDFSRSDNYLSLNGNWKFVYAEDVELLPAGAEQPATDCSDWAEIRVPGNWELQGFGDPIYTNHPYEFAPVAPQPPQLPERIEAGVYRRTFVVPDSWRGRRVLLNLAGAKSGVTVYVNGREMGYNENSKDLAQFDVTAGLVPGENTLALRITRWSTGSYLECQDFWRISGIERDVYLSSESAGGLRDFDVLSTLDTDCTTGIFRLEMIGWPDARGTAGFELLDASGRRVASSDPEREWSDGKAVFEARIPQVEAWSAEVPNLYTLLLHATCDGRTEYVPFRVGFRRFEIADSPEKDASGRPYKVFLVNGQPVKFKGVNLHEHSAQTGHYVDEALLRRDLELMRRHNINAIRTCHYPQQRRFYELCDELGFYVCCEANIESHGMGYNLAKGRTLANNRDWLESHLMRIGDMYGRCRNYPSVVFWSLGNEAGNGYNFYRAYEWLEEREHGAGRSNRPICYERAVWEWNTDMYVPQYPGAAWFERIGREGSDRPVVPSEYAHAMGNSTGGLWLQWQSIYRYPNLQGGFIWDWVDQGFDAVDAEGRRYWTYGGDYGRRRPSDGNFNCNGLVNPDRTPHPALAEVRHVYSDVAFGRTDDGDYEVFNRFYFKSLRDYKLRYEIKADGETVSRGYLPLSAAPQTVQRVRIPAVKLVPGKEYFACLAVETTHADALLPAGHTIASDQFLLQAGTQPAFRCDGAALTFGQHDGLVEAVSPKVRFAVDASTGRAVSYVVGGREFFHDGFGVRPNFWRAPTDNDYGNGLPARTQVWKEAGSRAATSVRGERSADGSVRIVSAYDYADGVRFEVVYTIHASGAVHVGTRMKGDRNSLPELPRLGVRFRLPASMDAFSYYGRGPEENYRDRMTGTPVGLYRTAASESGYPYVRPQETGHHCDVRWMDFDGMRIVADRTMEFNALRCAVEDLDSEEAVARDYQWLDRTPDEPHDPEQARNRMRRQTHVNDVPQRDYVEVCLDYWQTGVGGYDSWGSLPEEEATLRVEKVCDWGFTFVPRRA